MVGAELITVKYARYGKQADPPKHEFILVQVEDTLYREVGEKGLVNYLILDRTVVNKPLRALRSLGHILGGFQGGKATETVRVSYDGNVEKLLSDPGLPQNSRRFIDRLQFPSHEPLHLYQLVALANMVSSECSKYQLLSSNAFIFAGVFWEVLCKLYPTAIRDRSSEEEIGKYGRFRFILDKSQVHDTCERPSSRISQARVKIEAPKLVGATTILERWTNGLILLPSRTKAIGEIDPYTFRYHGQYNGCAPSGRDICP